MDKGVLEVVTMKREEDEEGNENDRGSSEEIHM